MLEINIKAEKSLITDTFTKKNVTMQEVAVVMLRLEHIKQELICMDFEDIVMIEIDEDE